jgi:acylphosphatase
MAKRNAAVSALAQLLQQQPQPPPPPPQQQQQEQQQATTAKSKAASTKQQQQQQQATAAKSKAVSTKKKKQQQQQEQQQATAAKSKAVSTECGQDVPFTTWAAHWRLNPRTEIATRQRRRPIRTDTATDGAASLPAVDADALVRMEFTVHGRVQKVNFRLYTKRRATELSVAGWVKNTAQHTVVGVAEGTRAGVDALRHWLATVGSPMSRIARLEASPLAPIEERTFDHFCVDKTFGYANDAPNAAKAARPSKSTGPKPRLGRDFEQMLADKILADDAARAVKAQRLRQKRRARHAVKAEQHVLYTRMLLKQNAADPTP